MGAFRMLRRCGFLDENRRAAKPYSNCRDHSDIQSDDAYSSLDPLGNKGKSLAVNNDGSFRPRGTPRNKTDLESSAAPAASRRSCAGTST